MNPSQSGTITMQEFTEFLNCYDLNEVLGPFLQAPNEVDINMNVNLVDIRQFENQKREGPKLVYRDYPDD